MNKSDQSVLENAVNLFSGDGDKLTANMFPLFAKIRSMGPIVPFPISMEGTNGQAWMVTQLKEAVQILKDQEHFTVDPGSIDGNIPTWQNLAGREASSDSSTFFSGNSMLSVDDPDHRRLRKLVSNVFTPKYIEGLRPRVQQIADELLDEVQDQGQMDLIKDYAYPLPIHVISEMLGVPKEDRAQIRLWSAALANGLGFGKQDDGVTSHMQAFGEYTSQ